MPWIIRWTLSGGKKGDFFKGAPVNPNYLKAVIKLKTIEMFL